MLFVREIINNLYHTTTHNDVVDIFITDDNNKILSLNCKIYLQDYYKVYIVRQNLPPEIKIVPNYSSSSENPSQYETESSSSEEEYFTSTLDYFMPEYDI